MRLLTPPAAPPLVALLLGASNAGCTPPVPPEGAPLLVIGRDASGGYAPVARTLPELSDPIALDGELGTGFRGGALTPDGYHEGGPLAIDWALDGDVLVPLDEDGLVLWSFYAHLADLRAELEAGGHDVAPIFPVRIAYTPASVLDFAAAENAAFVLGQRLFVLFPDALDSVPLAANAGVVRHEFGHAWFELLVTGESGGEVPWLDEPVVVIQGINSLGEGFSDMVATLTLDEPDFFAPSVPQPSRDVRSDAIATGRYPSAEDGPLGYDPYALGTVYAALLWDVREATSPAMALDLAVGSLQTWGAAGDRDPDRFVQILVQRASGDARTAACDSATVRFPHLDVPC